MAPARACNRAGASGGWGMWLMVTSRDQASGVLALSWSNTTIINFRITTISSRREGMHGIIQYPCTSSLILAYLRANMLVSHCNSYS